MHVHYYDSIMYNNTYIATPCMHTDIFHCLRNLYVMAHTAGTLHAQSDTPHYIELTIGSTVRKVKLDRPGIDDMTKNKGDFFQIPMSKFRFPFRCIRRSMISKVAITAGGNDGWKIQSIATFVKGMFGRVYPLTVNINAYRWVDGNGPIQNRRFVLTKIP